MTYFWSPANTSDIDKIRELAKTSYLNDVDNIFEPNDFVINKNITYAIINQMYSPLSELLSVCKDENDNILAFTWLVSNQTVAWSLDKMTCVKLATVDLSLSPRLRVRLISDMMKIWEEYCKLTNDSIISSTTMRYDQNTFLKLHKKRGYEVRGSYAYKKLI